MPALTQDSARLQSSLPLLAILIARGIAEGSVVGATGELADENGARG